MTLRQGDRVAFFERWAAFTLLIVKQVGHTGLAFVKSGLKACKATQAPGVKAAMAAQ